RLPLLGHAWLYRWDDHAAAFEARLHRDWPADLPAALRWSLGLRSVLLRERFWDAAARLLELWRWREPARFRAAWTQPFVDVLLAALPTSAGPTAALLILAGREHLAADPVWERMKPIALRRLADVPSEIRAALSSWIDARGLPDLEAPPAPVQRPEEAVPTAE